MMMRCRSVLGWCALAVVIACGAPASVQAAASDEETIAEINRLIARGWADNDAKPSPRADDYEFGRRVTLDIAGRIPSLEELTGFVDDTEKQKRGQYVDRLLDTPDYIRHFTNIWANTLVGRGMRNANRDELEKWLRDSIYRNDGYDKFVYGLIAAEGAGEENGAINFLSAHLNDGAVPATSITARVFLGMQVQCTQCHNHPFNDWKQSQFWGLNAFFRGTQRRNNGDRREQILMDRPVTGLVFFEKRNGLQEAINRKFVDGTPATADEYTKPRTQLAQMITDPKRPYMAAAQVNRMWAHFFGVGFTKPVDDMGPHNPASHPELLDFLTKEFTESGFDNKRLIRWIAGSDAYQLTSRFGEGNLRDDPNSGNTPLFSRMYVKHFTAEQLYDSLIVATDAHKAKRNADAAEKQRREWLGQFVRTFGTDENDEATVFNGTIPQALVLMNGELIRSATSDVQGSFLHRLLESRGGDVAAEKPAKGAKKPRPTRKPAKNPIRAKIDTLFLASLGRPADNDEVQRLEKVLSDNRSQNGIQAFEDLFWALLNSNEFIINH
ncbi:MAG TPA: DUF1549 and DUF1553 domain-containing protein [Planctomycetaceae bacterium]|nr:DUF1549 and DUF1553 domain-containing protein [Planctomycetaceae bacterium]